MSEIVYLLAQIPAERSHVAPPAGREEIEALDLRVREAFGCCLPDDYTAFLQLADGLSWNGILIYGSRRRWIGEGKQRWCLDGFLEANLIPREVSGMERMLLLGESGMDYYVQHLDAGDCRMIDRVSLDCYETFPGFAALLAEALRRSL